MIRAPADGSWRPGLAVVAVCMFVGFGLGYGNFLSSDNLTTIALDASSVLIAGIGTMALLLSGNVDLSIGSQYALISVVTALVVKHTGSMPLGLLVGPSLGVLLGALNGVLVVVLSISPLIVTLATLAIYRGLAYVAGGGTSVFDLPGSFTALGSDRLLGLPLEVIVAIAVGVIGSWLFLSTVSGLRLFAIGGNRRAAALVGVPVNRLVVTTFALNGALIGVVAVLSAATLESGSPLIGVGFELNVLTAVILGGVAFTGGRGHPVGVVVGVLTLAVLDAGLIFAGLEDWYQQIARGTLLLLALAADQLLLRRELRRIRHGAGRRTPPIHPPAGPPAAPPGETPRIVLEIKDLTVRFTAGDALDNVNLRAGAGEVICLVGDNGAGKSTLAKTICGAVAPTEGSVMLDGHELGADPAAARRAGVETVFQELALCPNLSVADNLALGLEPTRRIARIVPARDIRAAERTAEARLDRLGVSLGDLRRPVRLLSGGERQIVQILRVMRDDVRLVILDEPTAALGISQAAEVLRLARRIAQLGRPVLLITHDVEEVFEVANRVVVLQRGSMIFDGPVTSVSRLELLRLMSGRSQLEAARISAAVTTERKRIERDLHDGAQQKLVNAALSLQLARDQLDGAASGVIGELLGSSKEMLQSALGDLRDLSRGIYPALLSEYGLVPAVESLIRSNTLPVEFEAEPIPRLPEQTEIAAYFVIAEALTNVLKHAQASQIRVGVEYYRDALDVSVSDDGIGGADESAGSGIRGLRGRVVAVGGTLRVDSPSGEGTVLSATFPAKREPS